jgi:hypothetical protein
MNQRATKLYLIRKALYAVEIYTDLVAMLGSELASDPYVTHYLCHAKFATSKSDIILSKPEPEFDDSDKVILLALSEQPFALVQQFAKLRHLSRPTVYTPLAQILSFPGRHLRWFPILCRTLKSQNVWSSRKNTY